MRISIQLIFICFVSLYISCSNINSIQLKQKTNLILHDKYPRWLVDKYPTDQTSGIDFIKSENGLKYFILVDDIGEIHILRMNDEILELKQIEIQNNVYDYLTKFIKQDFEEITYDRYTKKYYLSIEGNGTDFKDFVGIYELFFETKNEIPIKLIDIKKVNFPEWEQLTKYTASNVGFEGVATSQKYLFLGLEGFEKDGNFLESTVLYICDKNTKKLLKEIDTKDLNIFTICGLYAENDQILWGVDRNNAKIFKIYFDSNINILEVEIFSTKNHIPGYKQYNYAASLESITLDDVKGIYLVDDPWKKYYLPEKEIFDKLDNQTKNYFEKFIPMIYKYEFKSED